MRLEEQITAALAGRAAQRSFVDDLASNWGTLSSSFIALSLAAADLARAAGSARPADSAHAKAFGELDRFLAARGDWRQRAAGVSSRLDECARQIHVLQTRVNRETVNIGVIGTTGAGKSTLLRKLSGLTEEHIPSNHYASSTAAPSRIFHDPQSEYGRANLHLHTWDSFREEVLEPLHQQAKLGKPAPLSLRDFRAFDYANARVPAGEAGAERFLIRLRKAHDSLDSYDTLLEGGVGTITLESLRPYVAYPEDEGSLDRPYHAVKSVDIFCKFPEVDVVRIGLVDLPGAGEAGLDVHGRFLASLRNETDLLFIVKRPDKSPATEQDWDAKQLADDAAAGVRLGDFAFQVINRDAELRDDFFAKAVDRARREGGRLASEILICDIAETSPAGVRERVLLPVMKHLAANLADMDRDAVTFVLGKLATTADEARLLAQELRTLLDFLEATLPDEGKRHRARVRDLTHEIGTELERVEEAYDKLADSAELGAEIDRAGREIRDWLSAGMGHGSTDKWLEDFGKAKGGQKVGDALDRTYNEARNYVESQFSGIDVSLERAVTKLWGEVATALRGKLTPLIVPEGPDSRAVLEQFNANALAVSAQSISRATTRLLDLQADYGSIFLRVGRPIIRRIRWYNSGQAAPGVTAAGNIAGHAAAGAADALLGRESKPSEDWWEDFSDEPTISQRLVGQPVKKAVEGIGSLVTGDAGGGDLSDPKTAHQRLTASIESIIAELDHDFKAEAKRTIVVLAAAVALFRDSATAESEIEVEYERLSALAQREIWKSDYSDSTAIVTADLAALRQHAAGTIAAVDGTSRLINQARRL
jgi:hypothetical protein